MIRLWSHHDNTQSVRAELMKDRPAFIREEEEKRNQRDGKDKGKRQKREIGLASGKPFLEVGLSYHKNHIHLNKI